MTTWKRFSKQLNSKPKPCLNRLKTNATRKRYVGQKEGKITNSTISVSLKMTTKRHDTLKTKELLSVSAFSNPRSIEAHQIGSCVLSFVIFFLHFCRFNHRFFRLFVRQFTSSALLRFDSQLQRQFFFADSFQDKNRVRFTGGSYLRSGKGRTSHMHLTRKPRARCIPTKNTRQR